MMKTFILHWVDGKEEEVHGNTIAEAFANAGYGHGAIQALDWYEEKKESEYGEPNPDIIPMAPFARKNLIQSGFIAGMKFAGLDKEEIRVNNPELYEAMKEAMMDRFEMHGLTREIEF